MAGSSIDPNDLRLRVQSCFSLGEMRRLLVTWGATAADTEGDAGALAQRVVRLGLKQLGDNELLRKLKAEKPLAEWPDPTESVDERWAGPSSRTFAQTSVAGTPPMECSVEEPPRSFGATQMGGTPATLDAAEAPKPEPAPSVAPPSVRTAAEPSRGAGLVFLDVEDLRRQHAPRRSWGLIAGAVGGGLLLLGGAFAAGLMMHGDREASPAAGASVTGQPAARSTGPGGKAASLLDQKLRQIGVLCDLPQEPTPSVGMLMLAQEACGRDEIARRERALQRKRAEELGEAPPPLPDPVPDDPPPAAVPARDQLPPGVRFIPKPPPAPKTESPPKTSTSCPNKCKRLRTECTRSCGPEPGDASLYDAYASCNGRCVSQESQCRRACP